MSADDATRRLTPTERLHEVTLAFASRAAAPPENAVTIKRNSKGVFEFELTVRSYSVTDCLSEAEFLAKALNERYPYVEPVPTPPAKP